MRGRDDVIIAIGEKLREFIIANAINYEMNFVLYKENGSDNYKTSPIISIGAQNQAQTVKGIADLPQSTTDIVEIHTHPIYQETPLPQSGLTFFIEDNGMGMNVYSGDVARLDKLSDDHDINRTGKNLTIGSLDILTGAVVMMTRRGEASNLMQ